MTAKTWLITGTSTGFGRSLATFLAKQPDVNVVATARHPEQLSYLDEFDHGQILKQRLDVTDRDEIAAAVKATVDKFGALDVLINNAGLGYFGTFEESDRDQVKYMFDVNVWGLVDMTRAALPTMRQQHEGTIVNFSSIGGLFSFPTLSFYHGTKYAVEGMTESLAKEVADLNIKLMLIEPSGFRTDWAGRSSNKAMPKIDDYKQFADFIEGNEEGAHHEPGDPDKAAQIIYDQVTNHRDSLPLRLPLGKIASDTAINKYEQTLADFKRLHDLSASADQPEK
ncbi:oxidoreductase [Lacticaseibacillus thailandensis]|uniref:Short chain dehydrogenase n=1 Tax=Lacticaseibacillus thailandensis DSM 22698 = JCM 13996 TaxID=1423810 RepID=A0A0R2C8Q3_9LACO|nr:oxidoreductase [Lacticaseibacillus thailandensis]KRM87426.1 short chain dehydrogenase [Lacticaseibacillus thailandensis DSM 22698 = JCM 13996]